MPVPIVYSISMNKQEISFAKKKYWAHGSNAKKRNVEFLITFEEWIDIWLKSGHWHERGHKRGQYVMSRYGDQGPYKVGNVFIQTCTANHLDSKLGVPKTEQHKLNMRKPKQKRPKPLLIELQ